MYLTVDKIATIIDYGYSTFKYDKKQYGSEEVITSGIFVNSYPMYDIFKFLIYGWLYSPPVLKRSIARYLQFFTTQRPEDIATNASIQGMVMWLPYIHPFSDMTYDTFWNFLWDNFRTEMDISITPTKVLGCNFRNCLPIGDILEQTVNKNQIPSDPFEYYDQINYLKTIPQGREWRKYVIEHYDYEIGFGVLYGQWLLEYSNFKGLQNMIIPNITGATEPEIANEHTINILINYLINVAKLVEIVNNLEVLRLVDQEMEKNSTLKVAIDWNSVTQAKDLLAKNIVNIKNTLPVIEKYLDNPEIEPLWKIIKWFKDIIS